MKTNASRQLDQLGVEHTVRTYDVDVEDLSAQAAADAMDLPVERVFKTLVVRCVPGDVVLAVIPGGGALSLKALAAAAGARKAAMVPLSEVQPLTGYVRGGVTALATKKPLGVYLDRSAEGHETIVVSAGRRGVQLELTPGDYQRATKATLADLVR